MPAPPAPSPAPPSSPPAGSGSNVIVVSACSGVAITRSDRNVILIGPHGVLIL